MSTILDKWTAKAAEEIDAAIFSGDAFIDSPERVAELRRLMARWERGLVEHENLITEEEE